MSSTMNEQKAGRATVDAAQFTEPNIKAIYAKTRTGADFPRLIQDLQQLGIVAYDHFVETGSNVFHAGDGRTLALANMGPGTPVSDRSDAAKLKEHIAQHQQGLSNYPTFCRQAGEAGVEKWTGDLVAMTCSYFDQAGQRMLAEPIPNGGYKK